MIIGFFAAKCVGLAKLGYANLYAPWAPSVRLISDPFLSYLGFSAGLAIGANFVQMRIQNADLHINTAYPVDYSACSVYIIVYICNSNEDIHDV